MLIHPRRGLRNLAVPKFGLTFRKIIGGINLPKVYGPKESHMIKILF